MHKPFLTSLLLFMMAVSIGLAQTEMLESGDSIDASLTEDVTKVRYTFSANTGERINLTLSSRQFDPLLEILDDADRILVSNDDSEGSLNSSIIGFEISTDGDYTVVVTSSDGTETGDYTLTFDKASTQTITYGDHITATLDANITERIYQFEGTEGDVVSILMESDTLDTYLSLSNGETEIFTDDDSGGNYDALIASYLLPETTTYFITATTFSAGASGDYTLSLNTADPVELEANTPLDVTIDGSPLYFTFDGTAGNVISIYVRSEDGLLDTRVSLLDSSGFSLGADDDGGYIYDPELNNIQINQDQPYVIIVFPATDETTGDFTIEVASPLPTVLDCDSEETIAFTDKLTRQSFIVPVESGQSVEFVFTGDQAELNAMSTVFELDGESVLAENTTDIDGELSRTLDIDTSGDLKLITTSFSNIYQTFELAVSCS